MARILILLITMVMSLPVFAERDEDKKEDNSACAHEANKRDLTGKERKRFMKECRKEARHEGRGRDRVPTAQPSAPVPPPQAATPSTPAQAPAAAPPQPAAGQPPQRPAQAKPLSTEEKRSLCKKEADAKQVKPMFRDNFMKKCMEG